MHLFIPSPMSSTLQPSTDQAVKALRGWQTNRLDLLPGLMPFFDGFVA